MKTKIVISAVNLVEGGPLTILRSCLKALNDYSAYNDVEVLALVHKKELCSFSNITYIEVPWAKNNWIYRIFFEFFYLKKNSRKIKPYLWFSLHDTSPNVKAAKRVVYCHNPTPFYVPKMSDLWCNYKEFFFSLFYLEICFLSWKKSCELFYRCLMKFHNCDITVPNFFVFLNVP